VPELRRLSWYCRGHIDHTPSVRVSLCVVTASAPDASRFQIYV
jgi:hypothetical protein